ncbi:MAG: RES family NAD+ phosphorylase [Bacilli bacterium]|nr:RES family NAD+ phosphorylase [Bacilli bacterium]
MRISSACFLDNEIKLIIESNKRSGFCDVLKRNETFIYDTNQDNGLGDLFLDFLSIYKVATDETSTELRVLLRDELCDKWNIFSKDYKETAIDIVKAIVIDCNSYDDELFDLDIFSKEVYIPQLSNKVYYKENSILNGFSWDDFCNSIKFSNRYHTKLFNSEVFKIFSYNLNTRFLTGTYFYRARINKTNKRFKKNEIGMPPPAHSKSGRIAADFIPCLYLANDIETAICEVRAGAHDIVDVGLFVNTAELSIVDFRLLDKISPFAVEDPLSLYINKPIFISMKKEMEKPLRSSENIVDYIPIQYLCDYIRFLGFDGVAYNSTMNENGFNVSAFSDSKFSCKNIETYKIKKIDYLYKKTEHKNEN